MPRKRLWVLRWSTGCYAEVDSANRLIGLVGPEEASRFASEAEAVYCLERIPFAAWFPKPYAYRLEA